MECRTRSTRNILLNIVAIFILIVFIVLVFCLFDTDFRSLINYPQRTDIIEDRKSELLNELVEKKNFSRDWGWYGIVTDQTSTTPTQENDYMIETASRLFSGRYMDTKLFLHFYIDRYENKNRINEAMNNIFGNLFNSTDEIIDISSFKSSIDSDDIEVKCVRESEIESSSELIHCEMMKVENNLMFRTQLEIRRKISDELLVEILRKIYEVSGK